MEATPSYWDRLDDITFRDETAAMADLLARQPLTPQQRPEIAAEAVELVRAARASPRRQGVVEGFLQEFSLGTREGLALMCLAEALLRTPDAETRDRLIAEALKLQRDYKTPSKGVPSLPKDGNA